MKKDVKKIIKRILLFSMPFLLWCITVVIIDPFNYFNSSTVVAEDVKEKSSRKLNSLMYNCIEFRNNPTKNIIIGDSRIRKFPVNRIREITGQEYYSLYSNAAKLNEIIDLFWYADTICSKKEIGLKNVLIGLNFNLYNEHAYADRVFDVKEILKNPLLYIFNSNTVETMYLSIKYSLLGRTPIEIKDKDLFWKHTINKVATDHYSKYKYPEGMIEKLKEINEYCKQSSVNLTIIIVPHHQDFHDKLVEFNLEEEEKRFKKEIAQIGRVIDFNYPNIITQDAQSFGDPLHTTDSISKVLMEEIFSDSLVIGREL